MAGQAQPESPLPDTHWENSAPPRPKSFRSLSPGARLPNGPAGPQHGRTRRARIPGNPRAERPPRWGRSAPEPDPEKRSACRARWGPSVRQRRCDLGCPRRPLVARRPHPSRNPSTRTWAPGFPAAPAWDAERAPPGPCARLRGTAVPARSGRGGLRHPGTQRPQCDWRSRRGAGRAAPTPTLTPRRRRGAALRGGGPPTAQGDKDGDATDPSGV